MSWTTDGSSVIKVMSRSLQHNLSHRTIFSVKFVCCNCEGNVAHSGAAAKSKESSVFLLAATAMVTLARTSTIQMGGGVWHMTGSRTSIENYRTD